MGGPCGVIVGDTIPSVLHDSYVVIVDRHVPVVVYDSHPFTPELPWYTVVMPVLTQFDMVVELDRELLALFDGIPLCW